MYESDTAFLAGECTGTAMTGSLLIILNTLNLYRSNLNTRLNILYQ
jgi:hypothetical protein